MSKTPMSIAAAALLLLLGAGCGSAVQTQTEAEIETGSASVPELTRAEALVVLKDEVNGCEEGGAEEQYRSCTVTIVRAGDGYTVTVTHDGFFDDSVKASRVEATVTRQGDEWVKGEVVLTYQCWPNRGHQDFSAELCV